MQKENAVFVCIVDLLHNFGDVGELKFCQHTTTVDCQYWDNFALF